MAKEIHRTGVTATLMGVLSIVTELVAGTCILFSSEGIILKLVAIGLVVLASVQSAWWADVSAWRLKHSLEDFEEEQPDLFDKMPTANPLQEARLNIYGAQLSRTRILAADGVTSARDPLSKHAFFFYAGLLAGLSGIAAAVYGLASNLYPSTLAGSIIASIGFVTLACALVSAEEASESESLEDVGYEQRSY
jgi:hypothetical protein